MLKVDGGRAIARLHVIAAGESVEVVTTDTKRLRGRQTRLRVVGNGVVRHAVVLIVVVAQRDAGRRAHAQRQRRCHAPALEVHRFVAARHVALGAHDIQAKRRFFAQPPVAVQGAAIVVIGADLASGLDRILGLGRLADEIDAAPGAATAGVDRIRALDDLHLLQVEGIARLHADVAHAVQEQAAGGVLAANDGQVAASPSALARGEGDARRILQHVLQRCRGLVGHDLLGHHLHRTRRVQQRRGHLGGLDAVGLVGRAFAFHLHRRQLRNVAGARLRHCIRTDEQRGHRHRGGQRSGQ